MLSLSIFYKCIVIVSLPDFLKSIIVVLLGEEQGSAEEASKPNGRSRVPGEPQERHHRDVQDLRTGKHWSTVPISCHWGRTDSVFF